MKKEFDIGKCFSEGWDLYKGNMGVLILGYLIVSVISGFTLGILSGPLLVGYFMIVDRLIKNDPEKPGAGDVFKGMSKFGPAFVAMLLFIVVAMVASLLPVIGQIAAYIISPLLMFTIMFITFEDLGVIDAFKKVIKGVTSGEMLMPIVLGILANLVGGVGAFLCLIGIIFTMPFAMTLYVCAYRQMTDGGDIIDAEVVSEDPKEAPPAPAAPPAPEEPVPAPEAESDDEAPTVE